MGGRIVRNRDAAAAALRRAAVLVLACCAVVASAGASGAAARSAGGAEPFLVSLSCPAGTTFCAALDMRSRVFVRRGAGAWSPERILVRAPADETTGQSVSCVDSTFCVALTSYGFFHYDGHTWTRMDDAEQVGAFTDGYNGMDSVACTSRTFCLAVGAGHAQTWNGTRWGLYASPDGAHTLGHVSCASRSFCVAGDTRGAAVIYRDGSWGPPMRLFTDRGPDSLAQVQGVSCATGAFCLVASNSQSRTWNGHSWTPDRTVSPAQPDNALLDVSCPAAGSCLAGLSSGTAAYGAAGWSAAVPTRGGGSSVTAVSCRSPQVCAGVTADGEYLTGGESGLTLVGRV